MFAEDLLREVRRAGYTPGALLAYVRAIFSRVTRRLPLHAELVRSVAATSMLLFAAQFAGALTFSATLGRRAGVSYLLSSSLVLLGATFWLLAHVGIAQGRDGGRALRRVPFPVTLTVLRLVSIPAILLLIQHRAWAAATWLFVASALVFVPSTFCYAWLAPRIDPPELTSIDVNASVCSITIDPPDLSGTRRL